MSCRKFAPDVALYVEGDLPEPYASRVEKHLAICADCRELLGELQASQTVVKQLGSEAVDVGLLTAVISGVLRQVWKP
jgi:anti-sigma factor RsiW